MSRGGGERSRDSRSSRNTGGKEGGKVKANGDGTIDDRLTMIALGKSVYLFWVPVDPRSSKRTGER